jgi:predicted regulator of Ras-like GTPase activity (Roadblock/LC7/MglB family)
VASNRRDKFLTRLKTLQSAISEIQAVAVVSVDGLAIASILPAGVEEDRVAAMSAAMLSLGDRISSELGRGFLEQVHIKGEKGYVVLMAIGEEAVLTVMASEQAKLGLIFLEMRRATHDLKAIFAEK